MTAHGTDDRFNKLNNWAFSFPYLSNANGQSLQEDYIPTYITTVSGATYEVLDNGHADKYKMKECFNDDITLGFDTNKSGGEESSYYLEYSDGKKEYFDNKGRWLRCV